MGNIAKPHNIQKLKYAKNETASSCQKIYV